ncbi:MAG: hypothetical protein JWN07_659 [Hyphomicrobiales bacterium]|nr:hypothetical protein [Hyphomicrobiales bacterium]
MDKFVSHGDAADRAAPSAKRQPTDWLTQFQKCLARPLPEPARFASDNRIVETYQTMRLRLFGKRKSGALPTLIVAPFAAHDAGFVDLMRGHSLVQSLSGPNCGGVYVTDWIAASPDLAQASFDHFLSELNAAIDDLGGQAHVVGLGVGGCLALIHAARFPGKIKRLVLAGAPVDTGIRPSLMTRFARKSVDCAELPDDVIVCGAQSLSPLRAGHGHEHAALGTMQRNPASFARADLDAIATFEDWAARSVDLPGRYARDLLTRIFADNQLATGAFVALGRSIDLRSVKIPMFVLAGALDDITPKMQALSVLDLVGTAKARMRSLVAPCGHFALFVGANTLAREWRTIAGWLQATAPSAERPKAQTIAGSVDSRRP